MNDRIYKSLNAEISKLETELESVKKMLNEYHSKNKELELENKILKEQIKNYQPFMGMSY